MKRFFLFFLFLFLLSCSNNKTVFWCVYHACANNKEKREYFKKTLTIQIKELNQKNKIKYTEIEKILNQTELSDKEQIKNDKKLAKKALREEKIKKKIDKKLAKKAYRERKNKDKKEKKLQIKKPKLFKLSKKIEKEKIPTVKKVVSDDFGKLTDIIIKKNSSRDYPDINNLPE